MVKIKLAALLFLINAALIFGQSASLSFSLGFPRGEFNNQVRRTAIGGMLDFFLIDDTRMPAAFGFNLGFYNYGNESRNVPFSYTAPDVTVGVDRTCNIVHFDAVIRAHTTTSLAKAYVDLLFGGAYAYTETKIVNNRNNEEIASSNNIDDFMWSYGVGVGLQYRLSPKVEAGANALGPIFLDFNVRYIATSPGEYLKEGGIEIVPNSPNIILHTSQSRMDLLTASLGVQLYFSLNNISEE